MGSFQAQNAYLSGLCQRFTPKVQRIWDGSRGLKSTTVKHYLQLPETNINACKEYFKQTSMVSDGRIFRAHKKLRYGKDPVSDLRGKKPSNNKIEEHRLDIVRKHFESLIF